MKDEFNFYSVFADSIAGFISEKKAVGYKFEKGTSMLKRFDSYVCSFPILTKELTKDIVLNWTKRSPYETISTQAGRISLLRGLGEYMNRMGEQAYIYPKGMITINRYPYTPYIFSKKEMMLIFSACDRCSVAKESPYRHLILSLLIRMLYSCGLRVSEALNLKIEDINLSDGTLYIRCTKFGKERKLPMSDALTERCRKYYGIVLVRQSNCTYFFPSPFGGNYKSSTIYKLFRDILWDAGISHTGKGPRLHDLRHTFAVHCLKKWVLDKKDLTNCLPYLSIYLGHEDMRGSQRYLKLTADLYPDIIKKVEDNCSWLIPEVKVNETN
ncbi:tyrosine-type recombinase/integrase [Clostridium sp. PL3]|uniref:Tyrosine-type recombinase/integrase n=1 Tax=Clostridium thailandense TaxID=2794346 RepID=A0A949U3I2_9CLOT|nr:tyrosine-type recombinase/integrase [Clostridium thailandense]MBV7275714.1 tyrosine-type recombinase/integrase [Clostridium thailandense]